MDYTKILSALSRAKDALEKKIDAVNTSVSGLPGTLDTQFTAVKNDIATVKTDVASVKSDTGINLPQKIDTSSQEIKTELNSITERVETNVTETLYVKNKMPFTANGTTAKLVFSTTKGEIVNITGKGALYFAGVGSTEGSKTRKTTIGIDGKTFEIRDKGEWYDTSGKGYWLGYVNVGSSFFISSCIGAKLEGNDIYSGLNSTNIYGFSGLQQQSSVMAAISYSPLVFKKSLTITFDTSENDMFYALYELEG